MPKEVTRYKCEICGAEHEFEEKARECEDKHITDWQVSSMTFDKGMTLPSVIVLKNDGKRITIDMRLKNSEPY